ncbi:MAG: NAD(P)/FAD-dependent oxidoreductase [Anaerolineae bacterium]|nr:NAD(P)/FAD-dependent oxidoreductase [Anaerolineae bacterium]
MKETEVIIVGGGPAGASCAWELKRNGVECIVLDRQIFPRTKLCAGWVPPGVWHDLEIKPEAYPHGLKVFHHLHVTVKGIHAAVPTLQYAIRRIEFDNWLLLRAGVPVAQHHVRRIEKSGYSYIVDQTYKSRFIVGAGGTHCPVYRAYFRDIYPREPNDLIVTLEEEFSYPVKDERCLLWFVEHGLPGYAWYVPKANGYVNVGVGGKVSLLKKNGDHIQRHWAVLVDKLRQLGIITEYQYKPTGHSYYLRRRSGPVKRNNAYLVGDAAALATRDLGEGIDVAIKSGLAAAQSIAHSTPYAIDGIRSHTLGYEWFRLPWLKSKRRTNG